MNIENQVWNPTIFLDQLSKHMSVVLTLKPSCHNTNSLAYSGFYFVHRNILMRVMKMTPFDNLVPRNLVCMAPFAIVGVVRFTRHISIRTDHLISSLTVHILTIYIIIRDDRLPTLERIAFIL